MSSDPEFWALVVLQGITLALLLISWAGLLIPIFPGLLVMWLTTLGYATIRSLAGGMDWVDWALFGLITALALLGGVLDNIIIASKMRGNAVPWRSILLGMLAGLLASIFFTPLVGMAAAPAALYAAESARLHDRKRGLESTRLYMIAWGWSFVAVFGIGALIIVLWMLWAFL